jgi:hypothetical protein
MTIAEPNSGAARIIFRVIAFMVLGTLVARDSIAAQAGQTQSVRAIAVFCQNATGSGSAEENLSKLKAQATAPDAAAAIAACETKATALRLEEQQLWVRALDAKKNWDCADSRRQFRTLVTRVSFYQLQASTELRRLGDCGEQLRTEEAPDLLLQHARTAFKGRDFRSAREQAWRLVPLRNSIGEEARTILGDIEQIEIVNELLRSADRSIRLGRVNDACSVLLGIQDAHASYPNMAEVKKRLNDCPLTTTEVVSSIPLTPSPIAVAPPAVPTGVATPTAATGQRGARGTAQRGTPAGTRSTAAATATPPPKTELDKQLDAARIYIEEGNLELASLRLAAASKMAPGDKVVGQVQNSFQAAKQARDLLELGINLIYQAKYSDAARQLASVVNGRTSSGLVARAHFYTGVANAHEFYLRGNGTDKTKAVQEFQNSVPVYSRPDFEQISPKIKQLYDEAVGN